jgi:HEAT repeat protein
MKKSSIVFRLVLIACLMLLTGSVSSLLAQESFDLDGILKKVAAYEYGQSREPVALLTEYVQSPKRTAAELKDIEKKFDDFLKSGATDAGKDQICRLLSLVGTVDSVPVLSEMLLVVKSSDMARYALERIPGPQVDEALRKALGKSTGKSKVGIINTLGMRKDTKAVQLLTPLIFNKEIMVGAAAANALGQIGDAQAMKSLAMARPKAKGDLKRQIDDAYLRCADQQLVRGDKAGALAVYKSLNIETGPVMVRVAALKGFVAASGKDALPALMAAMRGNESKLQAVAIRLTGELPGGTDITSTLAGELPKLPPAAQVQALAALADRGDKTAQEAVLAAMKSEVASVRAAAYEALSKLGDASSVLLLAKAAVDSKDQEQTTAREALYRLRGADVDKTIQNNIKTAEPKLKVELIRAVGERGITSAVDSLLASAKDDNSQVRRESMRALRETAGASNVAALTDLLVQAKSETDRDEAERALASTLKRNENMGVKGILEAYQNQTNPEIRASLLQVLGDVGDQGGLGALHKALGDENAEVRRAAILALSVWPDSSPASELLAFAKGPGGDSQQILALRGFIKLVTLPSERPVVLSVRLLKEAMVIAKQPEEKKAVLGALPQYACDEGLALASSYINDAAAAKEADTAVRRINNALDRK